MLTMTKPEGAAQRETPDVWRQRIEGAIKYGKSFHRMAEDRRRAMLGPSYIDGMSGETVGQEPLWWRVYRNFIPAVGFADPGFSAKSKNPGGRDGFYGFVAEADEHALNQNVREAKLGEELTALADDCFWGMGVTLRKMVPVPEDSYMTEPAYDDETGEALPPVGKPRMMCKSFRIKPSWTFQDPRNGRRRMAFAGHMEVIHVDEAKQQRDENGQPLYAASDLDEMAATGDAEKVYNGAQNGFGTCGTLGKGEIVLYHVWDRRRRMVYTLGYTATSSETQGRYLREARYFGPPEGPYTLYGTCWLEDFLYPLPLSVTIQRIIELMQVHRAKAERDAQAAKVGIVTGSKAAQKRITAGKNNSVWHIPGAKKDNTFALAVGGPQEATERHLERLEFEFQLAGGQSLALSGSPSGGASATADALAGKAAESQSRFARENFMRSIVADVSGWLWFYHEAPEINFDVTIGDPASGEMITMPYRGVFAGRIEVPLSSIELEIDPYSVGFTSPEEAEARGNRINAQIVGLLSASRQFPEMEIENLAQDTMDRLSTGGGYQRYINVPMHRLFREQAAQQALGLAMAPAAPDQTQLLSEPAQKPPAASPGRSAGSTAAAAVRNGRTPTATPQGASA